MKRLATAFLIALSCSVLRADFVQDFQAANRLFNERKWAGAAEAFAKLAETAPDAHNGRCCAYAVRSLAMQNKYAEALGAAAGIKDPQWKAYAVMSAMSACGKNKELLENFRDENISAWPEDIAYRGFYMRGKAFGAAADAIPDLEKAASDAGSDYWVKGESLHYLCVAAEKAGDTQKAIAAADKMLAEESGKGGWPYLLCAFAKIRILIKEKQLDQAGQTLRALNEGRAWGQDEYFLRYLEACGDLALARGDSDQAAKYYLQAVGINTHKSYIKMVQDKLDKLQGTNAVTAVK